MSRDVEVKLTVEDTAEDTAKELKGKYAIGGVARKIDENRSEMQAFVVGQANILELPSQLATLCCSIARETFDHLQRIIFVSTLHEQLKKMQEEDIRSMEEAMRSTDEDNDDSGITDIDIESILNSKF